MAYVMIIFMVVLDMIFLEYYFGYHAAFGLLVVSMIIFMMIRVIIFLEYHFGYHAAFGLLVVSMINFMMIVDVLLLGVLFSEVMFTCGS